MQSKSVSCRSRRQKLIFWVGVFAPVLCWWSYLVRRIVWRIDQQERSMGLTILSPASSSTIAVAANQKNGATNIATSQQDNPRTQKLLEIVDAAAMTTGQVSWPDYLRIMTPTPVAVTSDSTTACIVTAYFRVRSKFSPETYENDWMGNMLSIQECMIIFCEPDMVDTMMLLRKPTVAPTVVVAMRMEDLPMASYQGQGSSSPTEFWEHQLEIDPEKRLHKSFQLFWIWLSKTWFVTTAALMQHHFWGHHQVQQWMWADIGSFRGSQYRDQPLFMETSSIFSPSVSNQTIVFMAHRRPNPRPFDPYWNEKLRPDQKQHFYHSGSHAMGITINGWVTFYRHFCATLDQYATRGLFLGEDQCVLQSTCLLHPASCAYLPYDQVPDNRYFGLRYALRYGVGKKKSKKQQKDGTSKQVFTLWRPPIAT